MKQILIPVSVGELIDKITILEIKSEHIQEPEKQKNVRQELALLNEVWERSAFAPRDIRRHREALKSVNRALWDIEDEIRRKEAEGTFDESFVQLARSVYMQNDRRSHIKRRINLELGSELVEEKLYADYVRGPARVVGKEKGVGKIG